MTDLETFIDAAIWHGGLDRANALLAADPDLVRGSLFAAAILGDDESVRRFLGGNPAAARATAGPYGGTALVYLCFSRYLRLDPARTPAFVRAATALLDAGADPNDNETPYHAPETYDNTALKILVESGRLTADSLTTILLRKTDWHADDGIKWLLPPNRASSSSGRWTAAPSWRGSPASTTRRGWGGVGDGAARRGRVDGGRYVSLRIRRNRRVAPSAPHVSGRCFFFVSFTEAETSFARTPRSTSLRRLICRHDPDTLYVPSCFSSAFGALRALT